MSPRPRPISTAESVARRTGLVRLDGGPRRPAEEARVARAGAGNAARAAGAPPARIGLAIAGILGVGLTVLAARRIGVDSVAHSVIGSDLTWVLIACALMVASLFARAVSWVGDRPRRAARPPGSPPRRHLGDDDRGADVGDAAGPPRRAGQGDGPRPPDRADARDVRGPDRDPGLADGASTSSRC